MSTYTFAESFTRTHARRLAGRVTTDLRQSHVLYSSPSTSRLDEYREELEELLAGGYVEKYQFGFQRNDRLVWSMRYEVGPDGSLSVTGTAGGVPHGIDISGASWFNFLTFSASWAQLTASGKNAINGKLPFIRVDGTLPSDVYGYWTSDRAYSAGGVALQRTVFRSLL